MSSCAQLQHASSASAIHGVSVSIGGTVISLRTSSAEFSGQLKRRYGHFATPAAEPDFEFDVELAQPFGEERLDEDVRVWWESGAWYFERGDFRAQWNPVTRRGTMLHLPNPYAVDAILRITHTLLLAGRGGFLLHAASAIRNGRAFIFAGISGRGRPPSRAWPPPKRFF